MVDDPRARIAALADQCVMCGLCLPHCPTYALDGLEAESPRGRIALARALADGTLEADAGLRLHLDHCLGCLSCERVCPSGVRYDELLVCTRALLGPSPRRPRRLLALLRRPRLLAALLGAARTLGARRWAPWLARRLPGDRPLTAALGLLRRRPARVVRRMPTGPGENAAPLVALFPGCVARVEDAAAQDAAEILLRAAGFRVTRLPTACCGALDLHDGVAGATEAAAAATRRDWAASGAPTLLTVTPGCLGTLRRNLPGARVDDAVTFLAGHADRLRFRPLTERVALHVPCTQANVARAGAALRELLQRVPGLQVLPVPTPPTCCGAAGSHMLAFPQRAARLRSAKLGQIAALSPQRLLSSNIGCRMHLAAGDGCPPDEHPLCLLARQLEAP